ncbi:MAG: adenylate cyclase [Alphaproteobacteria bacterium]|jgi:class 3 adenylate cyclase/CheY-like chemotaxis protein|nr:adenylate cyclase [Alphaproteobacteria bacterium]
MHDPPRLLVVDDNETNRDILEARLRTQGYEILQAADGEEAIAAVADHDPDLILLDVMMPKLDGIEACRILKANPNLPFIPIVLVTAKADSKDIVAGLDAGADEYLTKPVDQAALLARVRSMLRIKALHDQVRAQTAELANWNRTLEERVHTQLAEIERTQNLRRFLPPQVADLIAAGDTDALKSHRREIVAAMCDLRGFTSFAEIGEPEDVTALLHDYHSTVVPIVFRYGGTLAHFMGDGVLIIFNDPLPCENPVQRAVGMALEMRDAVAGFATAWRKRGHNIGFGVGITQGYATIGPIGFEGRLEYSAIGTVTNLAARLCNEAMDGQIVVSQRIAMQLEGMGTVESLGELTLKGLSRPILAFNVLSTEGGPAP